MYLTFFLEFMETIRKNKFIIHPLKFDQIIVKIEREFDRSLFSKSCESRYPMGNPCIGRDRIKMNSDNSPGRHHSISIDQWIIDINTVSTSSACQLIFHSLQQLNYCLFYINYLLLSPFKRVYVIADDLCQPITFHCSSNIPLASHRKAQVALLN